MFSWGVCEGGGRGKVSVGILFRLHHSRTKSTDSIRVNSVSAYSHPWSCYLIAWHCRSPYACSENSLVWKRYWLAARIVESVYRMPLLCLALRWLSFILAIVLWILLHRRCGLRSDFGWRSSGTFSTLCKRSSSIFVFPVLSLFEEGGSARVFFCKSV